MSVVTFGKGSPLVLVPGIHGRWEYLRPCIEALAVCFRVLTFPLCGEPGSNARLDAASGLDNDARQIENALDEAAIDRAVVCGVSFGGLPAIRFAAAHPARTAALILASTPGSAWHLRARHQIYARAPWIFSPVFLAESPFRLRAELAAAFPRLPDRWRFVRWQLATLGRAPLSPSRMAARAALIAAAGLREDCALITAPTLLITGEPNLDRVVPVESTVAIRTLIRDAQHRTLPATGHLGSITKPEMFADLIWEFVAASAGRTDALPRAQAVDDVA